MVGIAAVVRMVLMENPSSTDAWVERIAVEREDAVDSMHAMMTLEMMIVAVAMEQCLLKQSIYHSIICAYDRVVLRPISIQVKTEDQCL